MPIQNDIRAVVQAFSTSQSVDESSAEAIRQQGSFDGDTVEVIPDANTFVQEASEEMSFFAAEKVERKLAERKPGTRETQRTTKTTRSKEDATEAGEKDEIMPFDAFMTEVENKSGGQDAESLGEMLKRHFSDVSDQYEALEKAEKQLQENQADPKLLDAIRDLKERLLEEAGPAVRAGINIAKDLLAFAQRGLAETGGLRELYRFAVLGRPNVNEMYQAIMSRYHESQFGQALDFLLQAAGSDLNAVGLGPSQDAVQLRQAIDDINHVQFIGNMHRQLKDLIDRVRRQQRKSARQPRQQQQNTR
ncbi:MAG: type III secretion system gatekeeper subunit SctW [Verrucomicrobia bacterium]|nr:type III secretion system gatekeeper subunit SctW [Verrucomicrobiota bacterium]